jgi:prepilin-type N-terminal cleavage/methylation domain-containing protein
MRTPSPQRGFTLIELLITVALSALVGVLIYTVFINQTQAYRTQADMGSMQQNLRVAMEMLSRDLASAGFGLGQDGTARGLEGQDGDDNAPIYAIRVRNDFPAGGGSDAVEIAMMNPDRDTWGFTRPGTRIPCDTNVITFDEDYVTRAGNFATGTDNDTIICFNPSGDSGRGISYVWSVSGVGDAGDGSVPVDVNTSSSDFTNLCQRALPDQMICGPAQTVAYYIDRTSDSVGIGSAALPVLYLVNDLIGLWSGAGTYPSNDDIPVALGIEDLQIEVCQGGVTATNCNEASGDAVSASWGAGLDLSTGTWEDVTSLRVHLVARTIRPDTSRATVSSPLDVDIDDGTTTSADADGYHRRVARTEVLIRNATGAWQIARAPF